MVIILILMNINAEHFRGSSSKAGFKSAPASCVLHGCIAKQMATRQKLQTDVGGGLDIL